jgi:hypothetical protein
LIIGNLVEFTLSTVRAEVDQLHKLLARMFGNLILESLHIVSQKRHLLVETGPNPVDSSPLGEKAFGIIS